jgi:hypothetical protein
MFVTYRHQEPPGYERCIDCNHQWESRFINDIGVCTMCRLHVMMLPPNPLLAS